MAADEKGHNGWSNYETWCAHLWISNDQGSHEYTDDLARDFYRVAIEEQIQAGTAIDRVEATEEAAQKLSEMLEADWDEDAELPRKLDGTMYADLLNAALSEVDWDEIADAYVTECGRAEIERELTEVGAVDSDD
jgi:hypothetical protein